MAAQLDNIHIVTAALTGTIYLGRMSKADPRICTDKREAEAECFEAVVRHLQHGYGEPCAVQKDFTFDGEQWWRIRVEPVAAPETADAA